MGVVEKVIVIGVAGIALAIVLLTAVALPDKVPGWVAPGLLVLALVAVVTGFFAMQS